MVTDLWMSNSQMKCYHFIHAITISQTYVPSTVATDALLFRWPEFHVGILLVPLVFPLVQVFYHCLGNYWWRVSANIPEFIDGERAGVFSERRRSNLYLFEFELWKFLFLTFGLFSWRPSLPLSAGICFGNMFYLKEHEKIIEVGFGESWVGYT